MLDGNAAIGALDAEQLKSLPADRAPLLADLRDESTEQVRIVLEPKSRNVEPAVLMETLFRATALESRFRGGTRLDDPARRGAVTLRTGLLEEGTGDMDSQAFAAARALMRPAPWPPPV